MNLTLFRQLYESTFKAEPLLAGFWSVAMYDLEEESFSSWATMREKLEENARNQRKMLKNKNVFLRKKHGLNRAFCFFMPDGFPRVYGWLNEYDNDAVRKFGSHTKLTQCLSLIVFIV